MSGGNITYGLQVLHEPQYEHILSQLQYLQLDDKDWCLSGSDIQEYVWSLDSVQAVCWWNLPSEWLEEWFKQDMLAEILYLQIYAESNTWYDVQLIMENTCPQTLHISFYSCQFSSSIELSTKVGNHNQPTYKQKIRKKQKNIG